MTMTYAIGPTGPPIFARDNPMRAHACARTERVMQVDTMGQRRNV
jgi:hypothetical protein